MRIALRVVQSLTMLILLALGIGCGSGGASDAESGAGGASGAASGGAESGGTAAGGGHHGPVTPCPKSAKEPGVGVWEDITPDAFRVSPKLETTSVAVDPQNPGWVLASASDKTNGGTGSVGVFRTKDCGAHWSKLSAAGTALDTGNIWQILVDFDDSQNVFATNGYGDNPTIYKSTNGGVDWTALETDEQHVLQYNFVRSASMDPTNPKHLVVSYHETCAKPLSPLCISETTDGGTTWKQHNGPPLPEDDLNGDGGGPFVIDGQQILFVHPSGVWYTSDGAKSWGHLFQAYQAPFLGPPGGGAYLGSDGSLFLGVASTGIFQLQSPTPPIKASDWHLIAGSPQASALIDDGTKLYASLGSDTGGQPIRSARLTDLGAWAPMKSDGMSRGVGTFSYDSAHGIVYAANWPAGLWRMRTR